MPSRVTSVAGLGPPIGDRPDARRRDGRPLSRPRTRGGSPGGAAGRAGQVWRV